MSENKKYSAALISLGSESSKRTLAAMQKVFANVEDVRLKDIEIVLGTENAHPVYAGEALKHYDCVYIKGSYKYAYVAKSLASVLEGTCFQPIDKSSFTVVHNKLLTHLELQKHNIPMPKTYIVSTTRAGKQILNKLTYPIIVKLPEGTQGKGVMFADSFAAASSLFDALQTLNQPFIIQEYIDTGGEDIRAVVVGDRVVAAMKRKAHVGEVRSNFHAGGTVIPYTVDERLAELCVRVAKVLKAGICGIDILIGPKGPLVIEANISPGLQGIMAATGLDLPLEIAQYLHKETERFMQSKSKSSPTSNQLLDDAPVNVQETASGKHFISALDFRASRVLLPEVVTKWAQLRASKDYIIEVDSKNGVHIKPL